MTPEYETTFDPSRTGAEHRSFVAFCEAELWSADVADVAKERDHRLTQAFFDCTSFGDADLNLSGEGFVTAAAGNIC
jgi:hypothetical protein